VEFGASALEPLGSIGLAVYQGDFGACGCKGEAVEQEAVAVIAGCGPLIEEATRDFYTSNVARGFG